jgi:predicted transcriptional regulator
MVAAHQKYGDRVDFYGVNVTVNESRARVKRYIAEHHLPFVPVYDEKGVAVRAFGAPATSYIVILDKTGHVSYIGSGADQNISAELAKVVGK